MFEIGESMKKVSDGFTLIELIIVISIITILSSILIPNYLVYINKANDAKTEQIGKLIFVSAMRTYIDAEKFTLEGVKEEINEDIKIDGINIIVNTPSLDGDSISVVFNNSSHLYNEVIYGSSEKYTITKNN